MWQLLNSKIHVATFSWHIWDAKENTWLFDVFFELWFWYFRILMDSGISDSSRNGSPLSIPCKGQEFFAIFYTFWTVKWLHLSDMFACWTCWNSARFSDILNSPVGCLNLWLFRIAKSCMIRIHIDARKEEMQQRCVPKAQIKNAGPIIDVWPNLFAESFWVFQHPGNPCCGWGTSKRTKDADVSPRATWSLNGKLAKNNFASFPI